MLLLTLALLTTPADSAVVRDIGVGPRQTLRTTSVGAGRPLVLIPGIFGAAYGYRTITGKLAAEGYRTIVIEPLGYGFSSHPKDADYTFSAQASRIGQVLDSLGITRALLVAQSTGASIAFRLAIVRPDLVRGLLSIDGGPMSRTGRSSSTCSKRPVAKTRSTEPLANGSCSTLAAMSVPAGGRRRPRSRAARCAVRRRPGRPPRPRGRRTPPPPRRPAGRTAK